jgi:dTMP kinase
VVPDAQPTVSSVAAIRGVLGVTAFRRLWYSTALSSLGDWLGLLATTALATNLAHGYSAKNYALGGVLVVRLLPAVVLGPLAGAFADRFDRRLTMIISDAVRFVLFLTIPISLYVVSDHTSLIWLYVASFLIECVSLFWMPAKDASVPNLVRRDQIEPANQLSLITTYGLTPVLGAGLFSLLALVTNVLARHMGVFANSSVTLALYFNAATFLAGALFVYFIKEISGHRAFVPKGEQPSLRALMREGLNFIRHSRLVGGLIIGLVGAFVAAGAVIGAGKVFTASLGGGNAAYGTLFGAVFIGLGSGMAFGPRIARDLSRRRLFGLALVFASVCLIITALMPQVVLATIFVVGVGFGAGLAYLAGTTLLGTDVSNEMRGRIFAVLQSLIRIVLVLALAAVPFAVAAVGEPSFHIGHTRFVVDGTRIVLVAGGVFALLAGLLAYRKMDDREQVAVWADIKASLLGDSAARRRMRDSGIFIAFEGGEGAGKSTQIAILADLLRRAGRDVLVTQEPGATEVGAAIRDLVLHHREPLSARAEALLFAADRADHVDRVIRPALNAKRVVLTDRYIDSSLAYQGAGRELTIDEIKRISRFATQGLMPDLTVLLDVPPGAGLARARGTGSGDKLEAESRAFHERVRQAFLIRAESDLRRYLVVDATRPVDAIAADIAKAVDRLLPPTQSVRAVLRAPAQPEAASPEGEDKADTEAEAVSSATTRRSQ